MGIVDIVRTVFAEVDPPATVDGANEQTMPSGRFEQEKETGELNDPVCGTTATLTSADWERAMVRVDGDAVRLTVPGPQFGLYVTGPEIWFLKPGLPIACA